MLSAVEGSDDAKNELVQDRVVEDCVRFVDGRCDCLKVSGRELSQNTRFPKHGRNQWGGCTSHAR